MVSDILTYSTCQSGGKNRGTRKQSYISKIKRCSQICCLTLPTVITLYYNIMGRQAINKKTSTFCNPVHNSGNKDSENNTFAAIAQNYEYNYVNYFFSRSQVEIIFTNKT